MKQLLEWLTEAAQQLYGDDPGEHADLVDRTAAVLRNSLLTSAVFSAFVAEDQCRRADVGAGEGAQDGAPLADVEARAVVGAEARAATVADGRLFSALQKGAGAPDGGSGGGGGGGEGGGGGGGGGGGVGGGGGGDRRSVDLSALPSSHASAHHGARSVDLSALPSSLRSLLDPRSLRWDCH